MRLSPRYNDGVEPEVRISYLTRDSVPENKSLHYSTITWDSKVNTKFVDEEYRASINENSLTDSWGHFVTDLVERIEGDKYFFTLTFGWKTEPGLKAVENAADSFVKFGRDRVCNGIVVIEKGSKYGRLHLHGVIAGSGTDAAKVYWEERFGYTKFEKIRDLSQVSNYVAKYCAKALDTHSFKVIEYDRAQTKTGASIGDKRFKWEKQRGSILAPRYRML